jgi:predicted dehydrogenase
VTRLTGEAGHLAGLEIALDLRTNSTAGDVYELELVGDKGSLMLQDFCRLKSTAPADKYIVPRGSYGRVESVVTLVDDIRGARDSAGSVSGGRITARQGRNAQRLLDAIVASRGEWVDVRYD